MESFAQLLEEYREKKKISKKDLQERSGLSSGYISLLTRGDRKAPSEDTVRRLSHALSLDTESRIRLFAAAGYPPSSALSVPADPVVSPLQNWEYSPHPGVSPSQDWGDAPHVQFFYGRAHELEKLAAWIVDDHCQLVTIQGIGGVGKTMLAAKLADKIQNKFEYLLWRSLQHSPPLENILKDCIQFFSNQKVDLPEDTDEQIFLLIEQLRKHSCLVILDNFESILLSSSSIGQYKEGREGYSKLLQHLGKATHRSCLLLTSREKPKEVAVLEGDRSLVRSYALGGLEIVDGKEILKDKGLLGKEGDWQALFDYYAGNPLALKVVSQLIREVFDGDIAKFLAEEGPDVFSDIRDILNQQVDRLSSLERDIMYWLAIEREPTQTETLKENILFPSLTKRDLVEALDSLKRRSLIESRGSALFTLQQVIMEYMTDRFVGQICEEIMQEKPALLISHALMKAQAKDYVRNIQSSLILAPIAQCLSSPLEHSGSEKRLKNLLSGLKKISLQIPGYAAGNLLNLLVHLNANLSDCDFSNLIIRQAYLRGVALPRVNFSSSDLTTTVFTETFGSILSVALSIDGQLLAAGTVTGEIRTWQVANRVPAMTFQGHENWVWTVAFSPDGQVLASGSDDQTVRLWEVSTGLCLNVLEGHSNRVRSVGFSLDGRQLISSSEDGTIRLWEVSTGRCLNVLADDGGQVYTVAFSPNGQMLASGNEDGVVRLWEVSTGQRLASFNGHHKRIYAVAFGLDQQILASGSEDGTIRLWEVSTGRCLNVLADDGGQVYTVAFSPNGQMLASGNEDGVVRLWEVSTGQRLNILKEHSGRIYTLAFSPREDLLISGSSDQTVRLWDTKTKKCLDTLQGYTNLVWSVAFSPNGQLLAGGSNDQTIRLWNVETGACLETLRGHSDRVRSVAFSPDGWFLASGSEDRTVRVWQMSTGLCCAILEGHTHRVRSVAFSPDGRFLASGSEDGAIRLWNFKTSQCIALFRDRGDQVYAVAFSPNGQFLASGSEDGVVRVWEVNTGQLRNILRAHSNRVYSLAFSPDGEILASGSNDQTVKLWEVRTGQCRTTLDEHNNRIYAVAFSPRGKVLASGSNDQTVKLWDVNTGQCMATLRGHDIWVYSIAFNPDGRVLASGGNEGTVALWNVQLNQRSKLLQSEKPYEGMNITGTKGLTRSQHAMLRVLGAVDNLENTLLHTQEM